MEWTSIKSYQIRRLGTYEIELILTKNCLDKVIVSATSLFLKNKVLEAKAVKQQCLQY